jgi:hypothetical protein
MASSAGFSISYALLLDQTTQIGFEPFNEQEISAKQFLAVNLRGAFDMVEAISAQGSHFETFAQLRDQFLTLGRCLLDSRGKFS